MLRYQRLFLAGVAALITGGVVSQSVRTPSIDPPVRTAVESGSARVTLELEMAQGTSVAAVQDDVLARLAGTEFELLRRSSTMAFLTLRIGPDTLARLESMGDVVRRVYLDATVSPQAAPRALKSK